MVRKIYHGIYDIKKCSGIVINWNLHISPLNSEGRVAILFPKLLVFIKGVTALKWSKICN